jgi:hypothetical protein
MLFSAFQGSIGLFIPAIDGLPETDTAFRVPADWIRLRTFVIAFPDVELIAEPLTTS